MHQCDWARLTSIKLTFALFRNIENELLLSAAKYEQDHVPQSH